MLTSRGMIVIPAQPSVPGKNHIECDLADYLGVRLKHLGRIESEVLGHVTDIGAVR